jgi:hypothetical protein
MKKALSWVVIIVFSIGLGIVISNLTRDDPTAIQAKQPEANKMQSADEAQPKTNASAEQVRNMRGKVFAFEDLMRTQANTPVSTINTVLKKMQDYESGLVEDTKELREWTAEARENVRMASILLERNQIPADLPEAITKQLAEYKALLIEANKARSEFLEALLASLDDPDTDKDRIVQLAQRVQAKVDAAASTIKGAFETARKLDMQ